MDHILLKFVEQLFVLQLLYQPSHLNKTFLIKTLFWEKNGPHYQTVLKHNIYIMYNIYIIAFTLCITINNIYNNVQILSDLIYFIYVYICLFQFCCQCLKSICVWVVGRDRMIQRIGEGLLKRLCHRYFVYHNYVYN